MSKGLITVLAIIGVIVVVGLIFVSWGSGIYDKAVAAQEGRSTTKSSESALARSCVPPARSMWAVALRWSCSGRNPCRPRPPVIATAEMEAPRGRLPSTGTFEGIAADRSDFAFAEQAHGRRDVVQGAPRLQTVEDPERPNPRFILVANQVAKTGGAPHPAWTPGSRRKPQAQHQQPALSFN